jgi:hypothetical protein
MWTTPTIERLEPGHGMPCEYPRQPTDCPCGTKVPDKHPATHRKVTRRMIDGQVLNERSMYLCTNAACAERIKLEGAKT